MRWKSALRLVVVFLAMVAFVLPANAALKKYDLKVVGQANSNNVTPNPDNANQRVKTEDSTALIDSAAGPNPVLRRFNKAWDTTNTFLIPSLTQSIFSSQVVREGPGVTKQIHQQPVPAFTGTGSTAATIRWGTVTGWTLTGSYWCNSNPGVICSLAMGMDEATVDVLFQSEFYDLGTWTFHGSGFTAMPFIWAYFATDTGNTTLWVRGFEKQDGTVPALPLGGVIVLGLSLAAGGVAARMRPRDPR